MNRVGIDLGGTKIEIAVLNAEGRILFRERVPTEQEQGYQHILSQIQQLYQRAIEAIFGQHSIGIGVPGAIAEDQISLKNSNTLCLNGMPIKTDLERILRKEISMENDANCFALAEAQMGAGVGRRVVFGVIMGTGCGGGLVVDGKLWRGKQSLAGEWGHMSIDPQGPECYCGRRGCVETYISGGGLERMYATEYSEKKTWRDILEQARQNSSREKIFLERFLKNFGRAMGNLINILDPDMVVLGGGVSQTRELYSQGINEVKANVFGPDFKTEIVQHSLGDSAGVIGAACL